MNDGRRLTRGLLLVSGLLGALPGTAVPAWAQLSREDRAALADLAPAFAQEFALVRGWYRGRTIQYYDFGPQSVTTSPVFVVVTGFGPDGTPRTVEGQRPIFSSIPGLEGYSAIWQVHYLVVGPGYVANTLRDGRTAVRWTLSGRARLVIPGRYVNCPVVPAGSRLADDPDARPLLTAWYKGSEVPYFDFGRASPAPAPIWVAVTGFADGAPQFLRAQSNIVDVVPDGTDAYRDLWDVTFVQPPAGYAPDTAREAAALAGWPQTRAGMVRNCPVVLVDGRRAPRPAGP